MKDPNLHKFYERVNRIEESHAAGVGFEAPGTIGWVKMRKLRPRGRKLPWVRVALYLTVTFTLMKALVLAQIGVDSYAQRLASLGGPDNVLFYAFYPGPVTQLVAEPLAGFLRGLR